MQELISTYVYDIEKLHILNFKSFKEYHRIHEEINPIYCLLSSVPGN